MKNRLVFLNYDSIEPIAKEYFIRECGFQSNNGNHQELLEEGLQVLEKGKDRLNPSAVLSSIERNAFQKSSLIIKNKVFTCPAFEQIPDENILKIYPYLLTVGKCEFEGKNMLEQYYADVWGNAFLQGGRELLRDQIAHIASQTYPLFYVTYSFGPGFYGMNLNKLTDLSEVLDGELIGFSKDESNIMNTCKYCGGFFFVVKDQTKLPAINCKDCIGHEEGCRFCGGRNLTPNRDTCLKLLKRYNTPPHVVRHCKAVTDVALQIAKALNSKGYDIDLKLLEAAALLHDIARVEKNHGLKGAIIAQKHGYKQVSNLIKCHMFYATDPIKEKINEQDILCLADRMVKEDQYVGIETRMRSVLDKYKGDPLIENRIRHRLEENQLLKKRIENIIGLTIDELVK